MVTERPNWTRRETIAWMLRAAALAGVPLSGRLPATPVAGYGRDPDMLEPKRSWPLTLTPAQREHLVRYADALLPADSHGPAPGSVGIADFLDEWFSAPYPTQRRDRDLILPAIDARTQLIGSDEPAASRLRTLTVLGYYTTPEGQRDIGHVVPAPASHYAGPDETMLALLRKRLP